MVLVLALGLGFVLKLERTICFVGYINVRHVVVVFYFLFLFLFYLLKFYINSDQGKGKDEVRVGILIFCLIIITGYNIFSELYWGKML